MMIRDLLLDKGKNYFYLMHLSYNGKQRRELWNFAKENDLIGLDVPEIVTDDWSKICHSVKRRLSKTWIRQFNIFCTEMQAGDIVIILNGWDSILGIAELTKNSYEYDRALSAEQKFFDHIRKVKWLKKYEYHSRLTLSTSLQGFNNTLSKVVPNSTRWSILTSLDI
jgi:predicted Mrr-cat superfamily restriction endonuclease